VFDLKHLVFVAVAGETRNFDLIASAFPKKLRHNQWQLNILAAPIKLRSATSKTLD
jgi:hypothetical protein